jgi:hypothetical protein
MGLHKEQLHLGDIRIYLHPVLLLLLAFVDTIAVLSEFEADKVFGAYYLSAACSGVWRVTLRAFSLSTFLPSAVALKYSPAAMPFARRRS